MSYILALDQGTTSSRSILFNHNGKIVTSAQKEFEQIFPKPGWVEHDPMEIWESQLWTMRKVLEHDGVNPSDIKAIGITNQRETTVVWQKSSGLPICNAIVWQDRRTSAMCNRLQQEGHADYIINKTGLFPDAYFSGTKLAWILQNVDGARELADSEDLMFGTVDTWLIYQLTGGTQHVTDYSNASRTLMYDIHALQWDHRILEVLGIPRSLLPEVRSSSGHFGMLERSILKEAIPITGVAGDQQAALFGQLCLSPGLVKNTYGTGCFMLMNTGTTPIASRTGLLTTIAWGVDGVVEYALEGSVFVAGAAVQWVRDGLGLIEHAEQTQVLAESVDDTGDVYFVPAMAGLGTPYWDMDARGVIIGITRGTRVEHLVRATLESIAFQTRDVIESMKADGNIELSQLRVDGGAAANDFLMQFQADILGVNVNRPRITESTALGAAYLAGIAAGLWTKEQLAKTRETDRIFQPQNTARSERQYARWKQAVERSRNWASED